jgi:hypothetical protein
MGKRLTTCKLAVAALICGVLSGLSIGVATASSAYSNWGYYGPYDGYSYQNQAEVSNNTRIFAVTQAQTQNNSNTPTGYIGALARLYKNSALCASNGFTYTSGTASGLGVPTEGSGCGSGTYYSYGESAAYNGNGYNYFYTFKSPSQNY